MNPPINPANSSDEDQNNYESADENDINNLVSPNRPHQSPSASPRALLRPDPPLVEEVLEEVTVQLNNLPNRQQRAANRNAVRQAQEAAEVAAAEAAAIANMPDAVDFEVENGQDDAKALEYTRTLKMEFAKDDIAFWFIQIENEMYTCGVRSQWMKRCVLVRNLPPAVQSDVKSLLTLKQSAAPPDIYKKIKDEIIRIHVPDQDESFKKALNRVLTGLPSQLGEVILNDVCSKPDKLDNCCCAKAVRALWTIQLPLQVRSHVADMVFNKDTYKTAFASADKVYLSTKSTEVSAGVAAISAPQPVEVAAVRGQRQNRGGRGGGRGGNSSRGGGSSNSNQSNQNSNPPRRPKPTVPDGCCSNHKKWASDAWFCLEPLTCPLVNKCSAKPAGENKNNKN